MSRADSINPLPFPTTPAALRHGVPASKSRTPPVTESTRLGSLRRWVACVLQHRYAHRMFERDLGSYGWCPICRREWD